MPKILDSNSSPASSPEFPHYSNEWPTREPGEPRCLLPDHAPMAAFVAAFRDQGWHNLADLIEASSASGNPCVACALGGVPDLFGDDDEHPEFRCRFLARAPKPERADRHPVVRRVKGREEIKERFAEALDIHPDLRDRIDPPDGRPIYLHMSEYEEVRLYCFHRYRDGIHAIEAILPSEHGWAPKFLAPILSR